MEAHEALLDDEKVSPAHPFTHHAIEDIDTERGGTMRTDSATPAALPHARVSREARSSRSRAAAGANRQATAERQQERAREAAARTVP